MCCAKVRKTQNKELSDVKMMSLWRPQKHNVKYFADRKYFAI